MKKMIPLKNDIAHVALPLPEGFVAISTCRGELVDGDNYSGFNACHYTGDAPEHVDECRKRLCALLGVSRDFLVIPRQTHSLNVAVIDSLPVDEAALEDVDALVSTIHDVAIAINTADCVPLAFCDEDAGIKAVAHSGWKGTVGRIAALTVQKMVEQGADVARIKVAMGPCICGDCFEVGPEVVERFVEGGFDNSQVILHGYGERDHIDLPQACRQALIEVGVPQQNISLPQYCSRCNHSTFFSARRLGINSGRTLTLIK